ncbi:hypothetical protein K440DRAFT_621042 [Wilcoxina mikolae CBS 423.85]|nr:hypothetical protein K440DRAFT_621042 [Wilcoxina mikolae CBS 423.85]
MSHLYISPPTTTTTNGSSTGRIWSCIPQRFQIPPCPRNTLPPPFFTLINKHQAFQIICSKPATLSIREYIQLLRNHVTSGSRETKDLYIDAVGFWRARAEEEERTRLMLEGKVKQLESAVAANTTEIGLSKKRKVAGVIREGCEADAMKWEQVHEELGEIVAGAEILKCLKTLFFVNEPQLVAAAMACVSSAVTKELENEEVGVNTPLCNLIATVLTTQCSRLEELSPSVERTEGVLAVVRLLMGVLKRIQITSSSMFFGKCVVDPRMGLTRGLVRFFEGMGYEKEVEVQILSGFYYGFFAVLRVSVLASKVGLAEALAAEEAGWYFLEILEGTWGLYRRHYTKGRFGKMVREGLERILMERGFGIGTGKRVNGGGDMLGLALMENAFVEGVIGIIGVDLLFGDL